MKLRFLLLIAALACLLARVAHASPWAEVGDNQLRSDVELLQASGVLSTVTIHWPLAWSSLITQLDGTSMAAQPSGVRAAAARLLARAHRETDGRLKMSAYADVTNRSALVYGFDGMGRGDGQAQVSLDGTSGIFSGRLSVGLISNNFGTKPNKVMLDGTYGAVDIWGTRLYAGYLDHWWGPGEISALQLSNNTRPMPQVGIERASTQASSWPLLKYLGSWQAEFFLAYMDGPRLQPDTYFAAGRLSISPLPGLEMAMARTTEFCGAGHSCVPLRDYFHFQNDPLNPNHTSDELAWDLKYSWSIGRIAAQAYVQLMNEDYSWFNHSGTSHLFGMSSFIPMPVNSLKLTLEYANSIATHHPFSFGDDIFGYSYTNGDYIDGMRYRGRTLGFSLDDDSTLLSIKGNWTDAGGRFYELSLHHATIGTSHTPVDANILTTQSVKLNLAEGRVSLPLNLGRDMRVDLVGRVQDDQPRPDHGAIGAVEMALRMGL